MRWPTTSPLSYAPRISYTEDTSWSCASTPLETLACSLWFHMEKILSSMLSLVVLRRSWQILKFQQMSCWDKLLRASPTNNRELRNVCCTYVLWDPFTTFDRFHAASAQDPAVGYILRITMHDSLRYSQVKKHRIARTLVCHRLKIEKGDVEIWHPRLMIGGSPGVRDRFKWFIFIL